MLKVEVITPEKILHTTTGVEVLLPTTEGQIGVRTGHIPLITLLAPGSVVVKQENGEEEVYAVSGGFVEILATGVQVLADSAERAETMDEMAIQEAIAQAARAKAEAGEGKSLADLSAIISANTVRLKAVQRKKGRNRRESQIGE